MLVQISGLVQFNHGESENSGPEPLGSTQKTPEPKKPEGQNFKVCISRFPIKYN